MTRVQELLERVKELTPDEREEFRFLLNSNTEGDFELSPEWRQEIRRRVAEIEDGTAKLRSWDEVEAAFAEMKERMHRSPTA